MRGLLALAACIGLSVVASVGASADTLTLATVDCGDGSPLTTAVDAMTLTSLSASMQALLDYPSGLSCALTTGLPLTLTGGSDSPFVVGGGRYDRGLPDYGTTFSYACGINFSMSAHIDSNGFHGEQSYTVNSADGCSQFAGHIKANVTCLQVIGNKAEIRGDITEATGFYAGIQNTFPVFVSDVTDNGTPSSGVPDTAYLTDDFPGTEQACAPGEFDIYQRPINNGNITVHD